jgi:creatinine amidohydrolase
MKRFCSTAGLVLLVSSPDTLLAQSLPAASSPATSASRQARPGAGKPSRSDLVEFEMMTWPEVKQALASGRTTALVYTGGTEQRGPQNVNGGHNLMARETVRAIAVELGNAIALPVLPYSPNNASADLPGTIGLTNSLFGSLLEQISEEAIKTGFKNVVLMGDHGGGQPQVFDSVAKKLDEKYAPQGIHVYYCDEVYSKRQRDFDRWLEEHGYPKSSHAGIPDTSEMLYLGGDKGWVRKDLIKTAVGDPVPEPGQRAERKINNGITGDARRSSVELGKREFEMKVEYAVAQIRRLMQTPKSSQQ